MDKNVTVKRKNQMEENFKSTLKSQKLLEDLLEEELSLYEKRIGYLEKNIFPIQLHYSLAIICIHGLIRPAAGGFELLFTIFIAFFSAPHIVSEILKIKLEKIKSRIRNFWFFSETVDVVIGQMDFYTKNVVEIIEKEIISMYPQISSVNIKKEKIFQFFVHLFFIAIVCVFFVTNRPIVADSFIIFISSIQYLIYAGILANGFLTFRNLYRI